MLRQPWVSLVPFLILGCCWPGAGQAAAQQAPAPAPLLDARSAQAYSRLQAQLLSQQGVKEAESLSKLAELDYDAAHNGYRSGEFAAAEERLGQARARADQAMGILAAEAAHGKTDGLKNVELTLESISYGLHEMIMSVPAKVRPFVADSDTHFADLRARALELLFAPKPTGRPATATLATQTGGH